MILKTCFLLVLSVAWVLGASFSNVFVQTGPEAAPAIEYYGIPSHTYASPEIVQLSAAPAGFEHPLASSYGYGISCTASGCFYPGQAIASVASVAPSANILAYEYNSPVASAPLVYSPGPNEWPGYKYSYVIVDQHTGDHKVHSELSDGGVVRGKYAFLQPDGLVRDVEYVADDAQGFNAIVKSFLPIEEIKNTETSPATHPPCHEIKSEALTADDSHNEHHEIHVDEELEGHAHHEATKEHREDLEARHGGQNEPEAQEHHEDHNASNEAQNNDDTNNVENTEIIEMHHTEEHTAKLEEHQENPIHEGHEGSHTHENIIEISHVSHVSHGNEGPEPSHHEEQESREAASNEHGIVESNVFISYNDIIKCIQAAMSKVNHYPSVPRPASPLTYLVLNKPC